MMRLKQRGFSLLEVLLALLVAGLVMGPLLQLLSVTNRDSTASMYEIMATSYGKELAEQLLNFNSMPGYKNICLGSGKNIGELLEEVNRNLAGANNSEPVRISLNGRRVYLLLSPLASEFSERKLIVEAVPLMGNEGSRALYFKVVIQISWNLPGEKPVGNQGLHRHESVIFLRQSL